MSSKKSMGLWAAISVGVGGMIGAGIFSILGTACQIAGNAVYISFILAGAVTLLSAYSYAKLGVKYPSMGGPVEFLVRGFGDGIFSGGISILLWIGYIIALALYARAFAALGFFFIKPQLLSTIYFPSLNNIFYATAVLFLAYEGFGLITNTAEDMKDPANTLPKALYLSVIIVIAIYIAVSTAVVGNLSLPEIIKAQDYALAEAVKPFLGLIGFKIMAVAALFSTSSAINATLYGGANVSYMIAKEGELPEFFERKVWGKGIEGLFITAGLVILFANLFDISKIAMLGSASFLLIYTAVNIGHLRLYKETGANPVLIWLSILGSLSVFIVLIYYLLNHSTLTIVILSIVLLLSFGVELIYRRATKRSLKTRRCE